MLEDRVDTAIELYRAKQIDRRNAREILMRPIIALAMGDPAGISPELTARLLALDEVVSKARIVVIGDRRVLDDGARVAATKLDLISASPDADCRE